MALCLPNPTGVRSHFTTVVQMLFSPLESFATVIIIKSLLFTFRCEETVLVFLFMYAGKNEKCVQSRLSATNFIL